MRGKPAGNVSVNARAVAARHDALVEDRDDAAIVAPSDQAAEPLLERERGGRQLDGLERIFAELGARLHAGRDERIGVRRERQLVDDDEPQRIAGHVDAFPERRGSEQHGAGRRAKSIDEARARRIALDEQRIAAGRRAWRRLREARGAT